MLSNDEEGTPMLILATLAILLLGGLVHMLVWPPHTMRGYVPTAVCGALAVAIALVVCWIPL